MIALDDTEHFENLKKRERELMGIYMGTLNIEHCGKYMRAIHRKEIESRNNGLYVRW